MLSASAAAAASDLEKTSGSEGARSLKGFDEGLFLIFLCVKHCKALYSVKKCLVAVVFFRLWLQSADELIGHLAQLSRFGGIRTHNTYISDISDSPLNFLDDCAETEDFEVLTVSKLQQVVKI